MNLTTAQRAMLEAVATLSAARGYPPSVRELSRHLGFRSTNATQEMLDRLERKGAVQRDRRIARSIRITRGET